MLYVHLCKFVPDQWHTHTQPFNGLFSTTTWVGQYQKDKRLWILLKQEMGGSGISWTIRKSFAPRPRQITMPAPHHSIFYRPNSLPAAQPTASKHCRHCSWSVKLPKIQNLVRLQLWRQHSALNTEKFGTMTMDIIISLSYAKFCSNFWWRVGISWIPAVFAATWWCLQFLVSRSVLQLTTEQR